MKLTFQEQMSYEKQFLTFAVVLSISQPYVFSCLQHIYIPRATGDPVSGSVTCQGHGHFSKQQLKFDSLFL